MGKLFVITRNDLELPYQAVQLGHGVAEWMKVNKDHSWQNNTLVYLSVENLQRLELLKQRLDSRCLDPVCFYEPDINNELTSVAVYGADKALAGVNLMGE